MSKTSIAVLPFRNLSRDAENEYLSEGLSEEIIHALTRVEGLKVTSRRSSFYFKDKDLPLSEIARELKVAVILEGSIRLAGDTLRVSAQLIKADEDYQFWSESWDRKLANIFEVQDEISLLIADRLREQFGHLEFGDQLVFPATTNLSAYEHDLKARFHFNKWNAQDARLAIENWEEALKLDAQQPNTHIGLADAYGFLATTQAMDYQEAWGKAVAHTQEALKLDPNAAGAHYQLANISFFTEADYQASFQHALKTVECDPSYPEGLQFLAFMYLLYGESELADRYLKRALDRDPLNQETLFYQSYYFYRIADYARSESILNSLLERNPQNLPALVTRAYVWFKLKKYSAIQKFLEQEKEHITPGDYLGLKALWLFETQSAEAPAVQAQLEAEAQEPLAFQQHSYLYLLYVAQGQADQAFEWLDKSLEIKSAILLLSFSDPLAEALRSDSRFGLFHSKIYGKLPREKQKSSKQALMDESTEQQFRDELLKLMVEEEPYLNPQLTLRSLSSQLQLHPNQLSWLLNESFGKNFNEFVNTYRINTFKQLALDPSNSHISLLGLAYESGFNSKTVFNTSFKKETGLTPKAFVNQHQA
ncbi:helix-turn-helix domain-containing protein [Croceimicrobium hydrocarbonivorans]|uniref:Helix-turn-helix domain-containing protein n=1 Tax=Croceimicrobium hydrocarbonivorans TaxID=2761580 RepID=A0A7H0VIH3_9FLAO|nr:helix-turn-helix domain-containing protein [Croceimicrobium hydrocarbonivorans]QNR25521.1 helix-turn-helix domain-containing protein [Croceimicrobium hydrocarbonivorans]